MSTKEDGWRLHAHRLKATLPAQVVSISPSTTASVSTKLHCWPHTKGRLCIDLVLNSVSLLWGEISADRAFSSSVCPSFLLCHGKTSREGWDWLQNHQWAIWSLNDLGYHLGPKINKCNANEPPLPFCHGMNSKREVDTLQGHQNTMNWCLMTLDTRNLA